MRGRQGSGLTSLSRKPRMAWMECGQMLPHKLLHQDQYHGCRCPIYPTPNTSYHLLLHSQNTVPEMPEKIAGKGARLSFAGCCCLSSCCNFRPSVDHNTLL